jgi:hypothetical protein
VEVQWENLGKILSFHEREFTEKLVPKNKLTPEMLEEIRRQIERIKTHLVIQRRTELSFLMIKAELNQLFVDLMEAAKLCGMDQIVVVKSSDVF